MINKDHRSIIVRVAFLLLLLPRLAPAFAPPSTTLHNSSSPNRNNMKNTPRPASDVSDGVAKANSDDTKKGGIRAKGTRILKKISKVPIWPPLFALGVGYRFGVRTTASAMKKASSSGSAVVQTRPNIVLSGIIIFMVAREIWGYVPTWMKRSIPLVGSKVDDADNGSLDANDLTSFTNIAAKLQALSDKAKEKLESAMSDGERRSAILILFQLLAQIKENDAESRDERYHQAGEEASASEVLDGLDETFEFADWAYNEFDEDDSLKDALEAKGFSLVRHDATVLPGSVAHYIAISKERKVALVGIKGTSSFEDMLTDCCGQAVTHKLDAPFFEGGSKEIRCHEGVVLAAERLAKDLEIVVEELLLPNGYTLLITGHSLGAGCAALVGVILRSCFPELINDEGKMLKVLAFASPPVLDYDAALACSSFTTTIVNNSDIIPRASLSNLIVMLEFLTTVHDKMIEKGVSPKDLKSATALMKKLTKGTDGEMIMTEKELVDGLKDAFGKVELKDPDQLYVPGKVIHMYDMWSKEGYGKVEEELEDEEETEEDMKKALENVRTAERLYVGDGTSDMLRYIELDARMLTDHLSPGYRSSIKAMLSTVATEEKQIA